MRRIFLFVLFTCLFYSFAIAQNVGIQGIVYDHNTGDALPGATLQVVDSSVVRVSNDNGRYVFENLPKGEYKIKASFIGFEPQIQTVVLNDKTINLHFQLKEKADLLEEIVVTGTGTMHHINDVPVMTEVVGKKFLSMYAGQSLEEVLAGISPSFDFNQNIMGSNIQMNGLGNQYILILVNGERLQGDIGGQNNLSLINPADIQKIEIVKGASSSLYGSDAIAGVVNIITKKPRGKLEASNTTRVASYKSLQQSNMLSLQKGKWRTTTNFNFKHSDGWKNTNDEIYRKKLYHNSVTKIVNKFSDYRIAEKISYTPNKKLSASIRGEIYEKNIERPCGEPKYDTYGMIYKTQNYSALAKYKLNNKNYIKFSSSFKQTKYYHEYTKKTLEKHVLNNKVIHDIYLPGDIRRINTQQQLMVQAKGVFSLGKKQTLSSGIDFRQDWLSSKYRLPNQDESDYSVSAYLQDEYNPFDKLNITAGARLIMHEQFGFHFTPKISVLQKVNNFNFRATWSQGFKTPTIKELHYCYKRTIMSEWRLYLGNKDLKPQTSNYFALATEYNTDKISLSVTGYYNILENMITMVEIPTSYEDKLDEIEKTMEYQNIEDAVTQGIDFVFKYKISKDLTLGGGYSYLDSEGHFFNEEDNIIEVSKLNGTATHHANAYAVWNHRWKNYKLGIGLFGKGQSKRFYREYNDGKEYTMFRINTSHSIFSIKKLDLTANIGIDNILDYKETRPYGEKYGTTTPGRTYYLSFIVKFKH